MIRTLILFLGVLFLAAPGTAAAASSSTEEYFAESARILGQVFAPRLHVSTRIHSHAELGSRTASLIRNQCDASGRYQFYFAQGKLYFLQVWKGKEEIYRSIGLVKGAKVNTFHLLSAAYGVDAERVYVIERYIDETGNCRYQVVPLEGADIETFRIHAGSTRFMAVDENHRYWFGERL